MSHAQVRGSLHCSRFPPNGPSIVSSQGNLSLSSQRTWLSGRRRARRKATRRMEVCELIGAALASTGPGSTRLERRGLVLSRWLRARPPSNRRCEWSGQAERLDDAIVVDYMQHIAICDSSDDDDSQPERWERWERWPPKSGPPLCVPLPARQQATTRNPECENEVRGSFEPFLCSPRRR